MSDDVSPSGAAPIDGVVPGRVRDPTNEQATIDGRGRLRADDLETLMRGIAERLDIVLGDDGTTGRPGDAASAPSHGVSSNGGEAIQAWSSALQGSASGPTASERHGALATTVLRTAPDMPAAVRAGRRPERQTRHVTPNADTLRGPTATTTDSGLREAVTRNRTPSHVDGLILAARGRLATRQRVDVASARRSRLALVRRGKALWRRLRSFVGAFAAIVAGVVATIVLI